MRKTQGKRNRTVSPIASPDQIRMACAGLGWSWSDLSAAAKVSRDTIGRFLRGEGLKPDTAVAIRSALEAAGVEFIAENGGGPGVRLAKKSQPKRSDGGAKR
jgi:transcriptional regulator with XRE-family HTH domain